jgi:hypothetical protein
VRRWAISTNTYLSQAFRDMVSTCATPCRDSVRACAAIVRTLTISFRMFSARFSLSFRKVRQGFPRFPSPLPYGGTFFALPPSVDSGHREEVSAMKNVSTNSKRAECKPAATPGLSFGVPASSTLNSPPRRELSPQQPIAAPTWARYIDSRMKHFGTR